MKKIVIYWRDIPSQVLVQKGREREKVMLGPRFQEAVDRAAMRAGKGSSDAYIAQWRRETTSIESNDDPGTLARSLAGKLEDQYSDDLLLALIRGHGVEGGTKCTR